MTAVPRPRPAQCAGTSRLGAMCSRTASRPESAPKWCRAHDPEAPARPAPTVAAATAAEPARPTTIRLMANCCPHAVTLYEQGAEMDRRLFATGTAAHEVLDALGRSGGKHPETTAAAVCTRLMSVGRAGVDAEPPLHPDDVFAGRDLALRYAAERGLPTGQALYEVGLGFDCDYWSAAPYESAKWLRCRLDVVESVAYVDDEFSCEGLVVRDYKSSWAADESMVGSIQMKVQAVAVWKRWRDLGLSGPDGPGFIRIEIANLRTLAIYSEDVFLDDDGIAKLQGWAEDVRRFVIAHNVTPRKASPGVRCTGCPYVLTCEHAARTLWADPAKAADRATVAGQYAIAAAFTSRLQEFARVAVDKGAVQCVGGSVGFRALTKREPSSDAAERLWSQWVEGREVDPGTAELAKGFLAAGGVTGGTINAIARALFPARGDKAAREEFAETFFGERVERRFGVWPGVDVDKASGDAPAEAP